MIDKLKKITSNGVDYPFAFTLNVMEEIQEEYGSMAAWSSMVQPDEGEPKIKALIWAFAQMINEGIDIENETAESQRSFITEKQAGRIITDLGMQQSAVLIRDAVTNSTDTGTPKNGKTTKNPTPRKKAQ